VLAHTHTRTHTVPAPPPPQVIEKAYKKLRLDALVIQQGRLQDNAASKVGKDDLLSMVRYGAELVFSSEAANITGGGAGGLLGRV
jgi:SWI/SNF-related matrix-associated actin-dependent regulator of chromatin subfamily A member 5